MLHFLFLFNTIYITRSTHNVKKKTLQVEDPLSGMLGTRSVSDFGILAYYNEVAWGVGTKSK
jgi:hypothetical protein